MASHQNKKLLIITYYWPPSGGAGVQRWLKFTKYLPENNWEPIIYTAANPEVPVIDQSLQKDVPARITILKTKVWEPYTAYKKFVGRNKEDGIKAGFLSEEKKAGITENIAVWIRGNFFIPDARRFWIKPSIKFLTEYLKNNPVDAMVSTGPPHSMHLIASGLQQKMGIPWLADFRDPWTNIDFYNQLMLSRWADLKHRKLERRVLESADKVVTINWNMAEEFKSLGAKNPVVITNGFDPDNFEYIKDQKKDRFEIMHIGSMNADRNPDAFWKAISEIVEKRSDFKNKIRLSFIGATDHSVWATLKKLNLMKFVKNSAYLPHDQLKENAANASVLFLPLNNTPNAKGITPGKLYEYLDMNKPIMCIGPEDGDAARIINSCEAGVVADFNDKKKMKEEIIKYFERYSAGLQMISSNQKEILKYSRKSLTRDIAFQLNDLINKEI